MRAAVPLTPHPASPTVRAALSRRRWGLAALVVAWASVASHAQSTGQILHGRLTLVWSDAQPGVGAVALRPEIIALLSGDDGVVRQLAISPALAREVGGLRRLDRRRVAVTVPATAASPSLPAGPGARVVRPTGVRVLAATETASPQADDLPTFGASVAGAHPWVTLACKFADVASEPKSLAYFSGMYGASAPGLDHYWRELSFDAANVEGSSAHGWFTLPGPRSAYIYDMDGDGSADANLGKLFDDCTGVATPSVDFGAYEGINMMFNSDLDGPAWGGGIWDTLDGVSKRWPVTWEPPWAYADLSVIAHEMGHGFGLPHSSFGSGSAYDNAWDVMSKDRYGCPPEDATYGCIGQHTIAYHKDLLGWIPSNRKVAVPFGGSATITLERLAQPASTDARLVTVAAGTPDAKFFTVEVRRKIGYDTKVPADAVVIHEVVPNRADDRPAHVIDADGNGITSDAGAIWAVGETFTDPSGVRITVTAATATGYTVQVSGATTPPTLTGMSPTSGPLAGATTVAIAGSAFVTGQTSVRFGTTNAPSVTVTSSSSLTAVTPAGAASGAVDVTVQTPHGQATLSQAFTFVAAPTLTGVSPSQVPVASPTMIAVTGTNFVPGSTSASFTLVGDGGATVAATVSNATTTTLSVTTPSLAVGTYTLTIQTSGGTASTPFLVYGYPAITSISPAAGNVAGGTLVTITGTEFVPGATTVTVGGVAVSAGSVTVVSSTQLTFVTAPRAAGAMSVRVTTPAGSFESSPGFEYMPTPTVTSLSRSSGPTTGATSVTVYGTNLYDRAASRISVRIGGVSAFVNGTISTGVHVSFVAPVHAAGAVDVVVTTGGGTAALPAAYRYVTPPVVTSASPTRGPAGVARTVTITGGGFLVGETTVQVGTQSTIWGTSIGVAVDSPTSLRATLPAGLVVGTYWLYVTTPGGQVSLANGFTVVAAPQITQVTPSSGLPAGHTLVTVTGANFAVGDVAVSIGGQAATSVVVTSSTRVEARTPASALGTRDVTVTTSGGSATLPGGFTYTDTPAPTPPSVSGIEPFMVPSAGGTIIVVRGDAFTPSTTLTIGGVPAIDVAYQNTTTLVAKSPPLLAGRHDVVVANASGTDTSHEAFITIGPWTGYFAEGATSPMFDTRIALLNPNEIPANVDLRFLTTTGDVRTHAVQIGAGTRATVDVKVVPGMATAEFSTTITSDVPLVADRTMTWDALLRYGAHAETAIASPSTTWYLAEGATHSGFDLFYLLQNPSLAETHVRVRYLRPSGAPLEKTYRLAATSRTNIWVNVEEFDGLGPALASTDVSAVIESVDGTPIIVERALYLSSHGRLFNAGHESAGVTAPRTQWFLAEGATGPYFDLFVLVANPNAQAADVRVSYLLSDGRTFSRTLTAPPDSRSNVWVDQEQFAGIDGFPLADVAVSTTVESLNGVPIIVERSLWWPGNFGEWYEAHNSAGAWETGEAWALADGEVGGPFGEETYVLIANTSGTAGLARVTLMFEDGSAQLRDYVLAPKSRTNVAVGPDFGSIVEGRRFGVLVESLSPSPGQPVAQIVVERAMYHNAAGLFWAAGTNALATRLR